MRGTQGHSQGRAVGKQHGRSWAEGPRGKHGGWTHGETEVRPIRSVESEDSR